MAAIDFPDSPIDGQEHIVTYDGITTVWVYDAAKTYWRINSTGTVGPQGPAATIAVGTTTTGSPGTSASVTNVGSEGAAVLNFTIPRGDVGAGFTGGSYNPATGVVTFTSNDGLGFSTGDLHGFGFTGGSYDPNTGIITFTSDDGLGFSTTDIRGTLAAGVVVDGGTY